MQREGEMVAVGSIPRGSCDLDAYSDVTVPNLYGKNLHAQELGTLPNRIS